MGADYDPTVVGSFTADGTGWRTVDVTALVQGWVNGTYPNYGLLLEESLKMYANTTYHSSEGSDPSLRPKMRICYTTPYAAETCVTIQRPGTQQDDVADAYIWAPSPDSNGGGSPILYTGLVYGGEKQSLLRFNFGITPTSSLCGYVYVDADNDGIFDAGEMPIANATVSLSGTDNLGNPVSRTMMTGSNGRYCFTTLRPGTYTITETQPPNYLDGKDTQGTPGGGTVTNDRFANIPLGPGVNGDNNNFGELVPSSICGYVYVDADDDGIRDPGESPIPDVRVDLDWSTDVGALNMQTATDANGRYCFTGLLPGTYTITESQPPGYLDGKDTQGTPGGGVVTNDRFSSIPLGSGVNGDNNNFGELLPRFTLGDRVWYDQNQNGRQDPNEPGYNGVTVQLFNNATCSGTAIASTTTAAGPGTFGNGYYQFPNLLAGPYCVQFSGIPAGWSVSPANQGDDVGDSDADPTTRRITNINLTANDPNEDLGIYVPGTLGDNVLCVSTGQGLANITVNLFKDFDGNGVPDGPVFKTTQTNATGFYQFTGLEVALAGGANITKYIVVVDTADPDLGACNVPIPPTSYNPPLTSTNPNDPNNDFKFQQPARYTLGDRVWYDQNQNGRQDPNEPGYNGVTVQLFPNATCAGAPMATHDDGGRPGGIGNGYYQFPNLLAGPYCVQFSGIPAGWSISPANRVATMRLTRTPIRPRGRITNINLTANDPNEDMGIYVPAAWVTTSCA